MPAQMNISIIGSAFEDFDNCYIPPVPIVKPVMKNPIGVLNGDKLVQLCA